MDIESSAIDFLEGKPVQKGNRGEHVSGGFDANAAARKGVRNEPLYRCRSEGPITWPAFRPDGAYAGDGRKQHPAGSQNSINRPCGGGQVVNVLERLS